MTRREEAVFWVRIFFIALAVLAVVGNLVEFLP